MDCHAGEAASSRSAIEREERSPVGSSNLTEVESTAVRVAGGDSPEIDGVGGDVVCVVIAACLVPVIGPCLDCLCSFIFAKVFGPPLDPDPPAGVSRLVDTSFISSPGANAGDGPDGVVCGCAGIAPLFAGADGSGLSSGWARAARSLSVLDC